MDDLGGTPISGSFIAPCLFLLVVSIYAFPVASKIRHPELQSTTVGSWHFGKLWKSQQLFQIIWKQSSTKVDTLENFGNPNNFCSFKLFQHILLTHQKSTKHIRNSGRLYICTLEINIELLVPFTTMAGQPSLDGLCHEQLVPGMVKCSFVLLDSPYYIIYSHIHEFFNQ